MINIDYSQITHAAERRALALKSLTALMDDLPDVLEAACQVRDFMNSIEVIYKDLDREGQGMLPKGVSEWMTYRATTRNYANNVAGNAKEGLMQLAIALEVAP